MALTAKIQDSCSETVTNIFSTIVTDLYRYSSFGKPCQVLQPTMASPVTVQPLVLEKLSYPVGQLYLLDVSTFGRHLFHSEKA